MQARTLVTILLVVFVPYIVRAQHPSDPIYKVLRELEIAETRIATLQNFVLKKDVGTFTFRSGQLVLLPTVMDRVIGAVFVGDGDFLLEPAVPTERNFLKIIHGSEVLQEPFTEVVFIFTDTTAAELEKTLTFEVGSNRVADRTFEKHQRYMRKELKWNIEAGILSEIYDSSSPGSFSAFIKGRKYDKLCFSLDPRGADRSLGPEEVGLLNYDPDQFGIWYLSHFKSEWDQQQASSSESKALVDVLDISIDATIDKGEKLSAKTRITLKALVGGPRVLELGLVPDLRVSQITDEDNEEMAFIQEDRKEDGSAYVIFTKPFQKDRIRRITVKYSGEDVIQNAGGGNFYVGERTSWYPNINSFKDYATYEFTFRVPKDYQLVATGQPVHEQADKKWSVTQWKSDLPLTVAGFNYAKYKKKSVKDSELQYDIEVYATGGRPDWLRQRETFDNLPRGLGRSQSESAQTMASRSVSPQKLAESIVVESQQAIRLFSHYFGKLPYGRVAISQQPDPFFGQSWPMLVYLPLTAFMSSTQLNFLFGSQSLRNFAKEVGSHEIAHQWWGHLVGWKNYQDQWISEGFSSFSAGLYLQSAKGAQRSRKYWQDQREIVLEKNRFGYAPKRCRAYSVGTSAGCCREARRFLSAGLFEGRLCFAYAADAHVGCPSRR